MENDTRPFWRRLNPFDTGQITNAAIGAAAYYVLALFQPGWPIGAGLAFWAVMYCIAIPHAVRHVDDRGAAADPVRTAAVLAFGLVPIAAYIPLWRDLASRTAMTIEFPIVFAWTCATLVLAVRENPPPLPPSQRTALIAGSAVIYGLVSAITLGGAVFILVLLQTGPPPPTGADFALAMVVVGLLIGAPSTWGAMRLWRLRAAPYPSPSAPSPSSD
jgi:hypothetical protein